VHVIFCRIRDARLARKIKHQQVTTRAGNSTVADVIAKPHCARNARAVVRGGDKACRARNSEFDFAAADAVENSRRSGAAAKRMAATGPIVPSMRQTPNQPGVSPQPRGRKSALAARVNHGCDLPAPVLVDRSRGRYPYQRGKLSHLHKRQGSARESSGLGPQPRLERGGGTGLKHRNIGAWKQ
jgi:hypothetical protein